jgi:hypothetical protein
VQALGNLPKAANGKGVPDMNKPTVLVAAALVLAAAGAQARDVYWSIGIHAPLQHGASVATVFSNGPQAQPVPVYVAQPVYREVPVYVQPVPVYRRAPVVYVPQPVYAPRRVIYQPLWVAPGHGKGHWKHKHQRRDHDDD